MERKLGQHTRRFTKDNVSHVKLSWDLVYDVPLIGSLQQMLSDDHILDEVRQQCMHVCITIRYKTAPNKSVWMLTHGCKPTHAIIKLVFYILYLVLVSISMRY